jgi:MYXO-CTERM domain-containing protein
MPPTIVKKSDSRPRDVDAKPLIGWRGLGACFLLESPWEGRHAVRLGGGDPMRLRNSIFALVLSMGLVLNPAGSRALVIETTFVPPGGFFQVGLPPAGSTPATVGGGTLDSAVRAAADVWEDTFSDDHLLRIRFGWASFTGNTVAAALTSPPDPLVSPRNSTIRFDNSNRLWFLDSTPFDNSEFASFTEFAVNLGAGPVNTGRAFDGALGAAAGADDLFTAALHEIGHALGIDSLNVFGHADGFIDVTDPRPHAGSRIPLAVFSGPQDFSHLGIGTALLDQAAGRNFGDRVLPSDADILAIAEVNGWTDFALLSTAVPEPASGPLAAAGFLLLAFLRRRWSRPAPRVRTAAQ